MFGIQHTPTRRQASDPHISTSHRHPHTHQCPISGCQEAKNKQSSPQTAHDPLRHRSTCQPFPRITPTLGNRDRRRALTEDGDGGVGRDNAGFVLSEAGVHPAVRGPHVGDEELIVIRKHVHPPLSGRREVVAVLLPLDDRHRVAEHWSLAGCPALTSISTAFFLNHGKTETAAGGVKQVWTVRCG